MKVKQLLILAIASIMSVGFLGACGAPEDTTPDEEIEIEIEETTPDESVTPDEDTEVTDEEEAGETETESE